MVFQGTSELSLDAKGRLAIPAKTRERLDEEAPYRVVVTVSPRDRCLSLYPVNEWLHIAQTLTSLPDNHKNARRMQRMLIGNAAELELDGQGRILLPAALRAYANLEKRVALVGQGNKFEIWSEEAWADEMGALLVDANNEDSDLFEGLQDLSL